MSAVMNLSGGLAPAERLRAETRQAVTQIEGVMREMPQIDIPIKHHFAHKTYGREMLMPKGSALVGKIHKFSQINVLVMGDVSVVTGDGIQRVKPPFVLVAEAGAKRAFRAHEDSIWLVIHGTDETDLDRIEQQFIAQNEQEFLEFCAQQRRVGVAKENA